MSQMQPYYPPVTDRRNTGGIAAVAWILTVLTLGYFLPWAIGATRGRSNQAMIGLINFLLGWTFVGWVIALVMACQAHQLVVPVTPVQPYAMAAPPAGWYPSPDGNGQQYWDGIAWTEHRAP